MVRRIALVVIAVLATATAAGAQTRGPDTLVGTPGSDVIHGLGGNDRIQGRAGSDRLHARDGEVDRITCGPGRDRVSADPEDDVARDCESVTRG
jgi:Ca2+-binding RTX toxin-like protein